MKRRPTIVALAKKLIRKEIRRLSASERRATPLRRGSIKDRDETIAMQMKVIKIAEGLEKR